MKTISRLLDLYDRYETARLDKLALEVENKMHRSTIKALQEFGETLDPEFKTKYYRWRDEQIMKEPTWNYRDLLRNSAQGVVDGFEFIQNQKGDGE